MRVKLEGASGLSPAPAHLEWDGAAAGLPWSDWARREEVQAKAKQICPVTTRMGADMTMHTPAV